LSTLHADKVYGNRKHREALKAWGIKNGIQGKAMKNKLLTPRQSYQGLAKTHAWHILQAMWRIT